MRYVDPTGHEALGDVAARERAKREAAGTQGAPSTARSFTNQGEGCGERCEWRDRQAKLTPIQEVQGTVIIIEAGQDPKEAEGLVDKAKAAVKWITSPIEDERSGDAATDVARSKERTLKTIQTGAQYAAIGGRVYLSVAAGSANDIKILLSGTDINGEQADRIWAAVSLGTQVTVVAGAVVYRIVKEAKTADRAVDAARTEQGIAKAADEIGDASSSVQERVPGTTRLGIKRSNPADWRRLRDSWDEAGYGEILSAENRARIARGRTPVVDDSWIRHFPGDEGLRGEQIPMHHIGGGPVTVPLPESRHIDAHKPGGYRRNPGGPGTSG